MPKIRLTEQYVLDYKREKQGRHRAKLDKKLIAALRLLTTLTQIRNLVLNNNFKDCRYCPIRPHLIMIYRKNGDDTLELVRLGSHSELTISHDL